MKEHIALSLLIMITSLTHTMKRDSCFSSNQILNKSKLVSDLRASKNEFENQLLQLDEQIKQKLKHPLGVKIFFMQINTNPVRFLQYCYYQGMHEHIYMNLYEVRTFACQEMHVNGYSAFGATMIAKETSIETKHEFAQRLIKSGFKPTTKDVELAELILYDGIAEYQIAIIHLLHAHSQANWFELPQEIRTQIVRYIIQLFKNEFWLLPERSIK